MLQLYNVVIIKLHRKETEMEASNLKRMSTKQLIALSRRAEIAYDVTEMARESLIVILAGKLLPDTIQHNRAPWLSPTWLREFCHISNPRNNFGLTEGSAELIRQCKTAQIAQEAAEARKEKNIAKIGTNGGSLTDAEILEICAYKREHPKVTCQQLSDMYQNRVNANMMYAILKFRAYKHVAREIV